MKVPKFLVFNPFTPKNAPFDGMVNRSEKDPDPKVAPPTELKAVVAQVGKNRSVDGVDGAGGHAPVESGAIRPPAAPPGVTFPPIPE